jgi:hypothetical protein
MTESKFLYYYFDNLNSNKKYLDLIQCELDKRVNNFGSHFNRPNEGNIKKSIYDLFLFECLIFWYKKLKYYISRPEEKVVLSSAYHGFGVKLDEIGYASYSFPWALSILPSILTFREFLKFRKFKKKLELINFNEFFLLQNQNEINEMSDVLKRIYNRSNIEAMFYSNDIGFFERLSINIAKELCIPTFIVTHGAAPRYSNLVNDNRTDYLLTFGDIIKNNFVKSGFNSDKIFVFGHPFYSNLKIDSLRFDFENILVISKPLPGQPLESSSRFSGYENDRTRISDRGNALLYLIFIEKVLISLNIKKARLRLHPSENPEWFKKFINTSFYEIDYLPLTKSLETASLVIGPTTSVFVDALFHGVNFTIFEPLYKNGTDILNHPVGHPFDGSDLRIPVAKTEKKLLEILQNKTKVDLSVLNDFVAKDFNLNFINGLIKSKNGG